MQAFSDYWLRTSAVIHVYKAWASGGTVQDVYFSLHTVIKTIIIIIIAPSGEPFNYMVPVKHYNMPSRI